MYSNTSQQGYTPENFPTGQDTRTMNVNPPMYSMDPNQNTSQIQHPSETLGRSFEGNVNSNSTQDFNYQQNMNLPMQNQGYFSNDPSNQNPYYGGYMYNPNGWQNNPNTWAYQQQQQMQMQQLYHYYQYMQQQIPNGFEQSNNFQNDFNQLSLNTEETVPPQEETVVLPEIKHVEQPKPTPTNIQVKPPSPKTTVHKKKTESQELTKAPSTWAQKVANNSKETSPTQNGTQNVQRNARPKMNNYENRSQNTKNDQTKPFKQQDRQNINQKNTGSHQHNRQHNTHQRKPHYNQHKPHYNQNRHNQKGQFIPNNNNIKLNDEEYEFTESNAIDRDEIEVKGDVSVGYDKNSFFDNLGEDDQKNENENKSFKESRIQDKETFGTTRRPYRRNYNNPRHRQNYRSNQKAKS